MDDEALDLLEKEEAKKAKEEMFKVLLNLDFTSSDEISLKKLINLPYRVDDEDEDVIMTSGNMVKILKMYVKIFFIFLSVLYKLGLTYKRQQYFR